jgi:hypothetical protein
MALITIPSNYSISFMNSFSPTSLVKCSSSGVRMVLNKMGYFDTLGSDDLKIEYGLDGNPLGLLCEGASENRFINDSRNPNFDSWSISVGLTGYVNGPCGDGNSAHYSGTKGNYVSSYGVYLDSGYWTFSFFACGYGDFRMVFINGESINFTLTDSYQRFSIMGLSSGTAYECVIEFMSTGEIKVCGLQVEPLQYASSYIQTNGGISYRGSDIYYIDYESIDYSFNISRFSIKIDVNLKYTDINNRENQYFYSIVDDNDGNFSSAYLRPASGQIIHSQAKQDYENDFVITPNTNYSISLSSNNYDYTNSQKLYVNKVLGNVDGNKLFDNVNLKRIYLGCDKNEQLQMSGYIKDFSIYSKILSYTS